MELIKGELTRREASWGLIHAACGALLGKLGADVKVALLAAVGWELVEPLIWPGWDEGVVNQVSDVILLLAGWALGRKP